MPISRRRASARASMTLATLAHATTRRMATAPSERSGLCAKVAGEILAQRARVRRHRVVLVARVPDRSAARAGGPSRRPQPGRPPSSGRSRSRRSSDSPAPDHRRVGTHIRTLPGKPNGFWHHANDGVRHAVEFQRAAQHVRRPAEAVAPHAFVDHDDVLGLRSIFLGRERPAEERTDAEHGGEVVGDQGTLDALGAGSRRRG